MKYENVSKITVASAITKPSTNHERKCSWMSHKVDVEKHSCTTALCSPAEGSSFRIFKKKKKNVLHPQWIASPNQQEKPKNNN